ncbi:MAG: DUF1580 domain-containing protein [Planctomycetota bacterium]
MQTDEPLITIDNRITLAEAGRTVGVSPSAVFRWVREGRRGVRLEVAELGRRLYTSKPALTKFMNEVAEAREANAQAVA